MSKDNSNVATRRDSSKPSAEKVRDAKVKNGVGKESARKQNRNDGREDSLAVIPNGGKRIANPPSTQGYSRK